MSQQYEHNLKSLDFTKIESGTKLTKFIAIYESVADYTAELHGLVSEHGEFFITDEIIKPKPKSEAGNEC